jgi:hypothetical protein
MSGTTAREVRFPWLAATDPSVMEIGVEEAVSVCMNSEMGHRASVACAGSPGLEHPVRWSVDPDGMVIRWGEFADPVDPPLPWGQVLGSPSVREVELRAGQPVRFTVLAVPERSAPVHRPGERGERKSLSKESDQIEWLVDRATWVVNTGKTVRQCSDVSVESLAGCSFHSPRNGGAWRAVRAEISAVVEDPEAVAQMMFGRYRAFGFGLPVFEGA